MRYFYFSYSHGKGYGSCDVKMQSRRFPSKKDVIAWIADDLGIPNENVVILSWQEMSEEDYKDFVAG